MFGPGREHWREEDCFQKGSLVCAYHHKNYYAIIHSHDFYEINIISNGRGRHHMGNRIFEARPGDVFIIPPDVSHGYSTNGQLDVYHLLLKREFLAKYADDLEFLPGFHTLFEIEPFLRQTTGTSYFLHLAPLALKAEGQEIEKAAALYNNGNYTHVNITTLNLICDLCLEITRRSCENEAKSRELRFPLIRTLEYIQDNLEKKLSIKELADQSAMSAATFNRHFKQTLKCTPSQYITECRVKKAMKLMQQTTLSKTEIALICGFYDSSHMNKYLREIN